MSLWASGSDDRGNPIPHTDVNKPIDWLIDWLIDLQPISDQLSASDKAVKGSKRSPVDVTAAAAAAADVQGAVIEKGIEVMGKMVDKQLKIIDEAQEKAENFLKKEVNFG